MAVEDFGLGSGFFGVDSSMMDGADAVPLPDNSLGAPILQPSDPTGNGSGQFLDMSFGDMLKTGLNFALQQDQLNYQRQRLPSLTQTVPVQNMQTAQQRASANNRMLLLMGGAILVAVFVLKG